MTPREIFDIIETLTEKYGIDKVEITINSMFDALRKIEKEDN